MRDLDRATVGQGWFLFVRPVGRLEGSRYALRCRFSLLFYFLVVVGAYFFYDLRSSVGQVCAPFFRVTFAFVPVLFVNFSVKWIMLN